MRPLILTYPHALDTLVPGRLTKASVWRIAAAARRHICPDHQHRIEIGQIASRLRQAEINTTRFCSRWDGEGDLVDDAGHAVLGVTEADPLTRTVTVRLNSELLGSDKALMRSTAAHELGHLVFDAPSWLTVPVEPEAAPSQLPGGLPSSATNGNYGVQKIDWSEWRANEFMGAFLAPQRLLHAELVKRAHAMRLPLVEGTSPDALPLLGLEGYSPWLDILNNELAALFGLSASFIAVRLEKYRLVAGLQAEPG